MAVYFTPRSRPRRGGAMPCLQQPASLSRAARTACLLLHHPHGPDAATCKHVPSAVPSRSWRRHGARHIERWFRDERTWAECAGPSCQPNGTRSRCAPLRTGTADHDPRAPTGQCRLWAPENVCSPANVPACRASAIWSMTRRRPKPRPRRTPAARVPDLTVLATPRAEKWRPREDSNLATSGLGNRCSYPG